MDRNQQLARLRELIAVWPSDPHHSTQIKHVAFLWRGTDRDITFESPKACALQGPGDYLEFTKEEIFPEHSALQPSQGDKWRNCPSSVRSDRTVTEQDFRLPEFRDANPEDYEFDKGVPVRKDRFSVGFVKLCDSLQLDGGLRGVETVCSRVADLINTERLFSDINRIVRVSKTEDLLPEIKNLVTLRNSLIKNVHYPFDEIEPFITMSNTSLLSGWELSDFTSRGWTVAQMVEGGHAVFKKFPTAPAPMPGLPPIRATAASFLNPAPAPAPTPMAVPFHTDREK